MTTSGGDFSLLHRIRAKYNARLRELGALLADPEGNYTEIRRAKQVVMDQIGGYVRCGGVESELNLPDWYKAAGGRRGKVQPPHVPMEEAPRAAPKAKRGRFLHSFTDEEVPPGILAWADEKDSFALPPTEPSSPILFESLLGGGAGSASAFERVMQSGKISSIIDQYLGQY